MIKALWFWNTFYFFYFIHNSKSIPPLYCHQQINTSDCGGAPTPVFSYYKPGSRCEIEIWRGCATLNKFDDEYQCVHTCIFTFLKSSEETSVELLLMHNESNCEKDLNTTKCADEIIPVYTYERKKKKCVQANWKGCDSDNKFPDEQSCITNCMSNANKTNFIKKLSHLVPQDADNINSVLNKILNHDIEELKLTTEFVPEETIVDNPSLTDLAKDDEVDDTTVESITVQKTTDTIIENISETTTITLSTTELITSTTEPTTLTTIAITNTAATITETTTQVTESPTITTTATPTTTQTSAPTTISTSVITTESTTAPTLAPTTAPTIAPTTAATTTPTTPPTTASTTEPTTASTTEPTLASTTTTTSTTTATAPTTTTIPPTGTVEEVVVPGVDDYDD